MLFVVVLQPRSLSPTGRAVASSDGGTVVDDPAAVRVLVVADGGDLARQVEALLQDAASDATVVYVEHAESLTDAARRLVDGRRPDVVLLDLGLSDVPGVAPVAGVAVLTSVPEAPPVVAITSGAADGGRAAVAAGASDHLDTDELVEDHRLWRAVLLAMERHSRTQELAERGSELARATTQLAHLSSRLRHDLRSPLAVAISALDTMQHVELGEEARDGLITMAMGKLRDLSTRLDDLARTLAAGELGDGPTREEVDLAELVGEVGSDLAPWDRDRLALEVTGADRVWAPRRLLRGLLGGLVRNALQHNPDTPIAVHVELRLEDGRAVLLVADDGIGIAADVRDAIFDVGWTTTDPPSLGVGLAAANSAVAMMEGTIRAVDSALGGAAFRIELPQRPSRVTASA